MNRFAFLAVAVIVLALSMPPRAAYPGVPISAFDGQSLPTLAPIIKKVAAGVVSITIRAPAKQQGDRQSDQMQDPMDDPVMRGFFGAPGMPQPMQTFLAGSGVVIDAANGYIVTNHHVVENADQITISFLDKRQVNGALVGSDPDTDIAIIKVPPVNLTAIPFGDSDRLEVGDFVLAIGNPFGIGQTVTSGIVSGLKRNAMGLEGYEDFIQTDASINPGNSGGALLNLRGELVGINSAVVDVKGGNAGIGFAIPVNIVRAIAHQLMKYGDVDRGELGFSMAEVNPELARKWHIPADRSGAVITKVNPHSAAEHAGIKPGDLITAVGEMPVAGVPDLRNQLALLRVGDVAELTVFRGGQSLQVQATLSDPPWNALDGDQIAPLLEGALFTGSPPGALEKGVQVATVRAGSNAWGSGLREGDVITAVNKKRTVGIEQFVAEAGQTPKALVLDVIRDGESLQLSVKLNEGQTENTPKR
jgi:Do/DeqQ family serine protease